MWIDLHLSFEKNTSFEEIVSLKKQLQDEFDSLFGNCTVNIIAEDDKAIHSSFVGKT